MAPPPVHPPRSATAVSRWMLPLMALLLTTGLLGGCVASSAGGPDGDAAFAANTSPGAGASSGAGGDARFRSVGVAAPDPGSYRLGPADVLTVTVFQVDELKRDVVVGENGMVSLPLIGQVRAEGKSLQELETAIARGLDAYLQNPQVTVFVKEYNSQKFTVEGAVRQPGVFPIRGQTSLLQAIATARGLERLADSSSVIMFRQVDGRRYAATFDLNAIRRGQEPDPTLMRNDVVYVEESGSRRFLEEVRPFLMPAISFSRLIGL